jgi:sugar phosphate isomerase/epimerase
MDKGKPIRIGNQTAFSALTPMLPFEYALVNGFDAFEWFPDKHENGEGWDENDIDVETRCYIKDSSMAHDIALSVHASLKANPLRPETCELLLNDLRFAQDIGATLLNVHLYTDEGVEAYVEAITPIIRESAGIGINLSIENTPLTDPEDFNRMFALLRNPREETAHVGMCLDIGHANLCNKTRNNYLGFIDRLDPGIPIIHIHVHENYGDYDSHLPLFTGPAGKNTEGIHGFIERIKKRKFSGSIILEQWPQPPLLLNEARDRLYHMLIHGSDT